MDLLNGAGVPYRVVDVDSDPQGAQRVMGWNNGSLSTPTLDIEGTILTVPSDEALADFLELDEANTGYPRP